MVGTSKRRCRCLGSDAFIIKILYIIHTHTIYIYRYIVLAGAFDETAVQRYDAAESARVRGFGLVFLVRYISDLEPTKTIHIQCVIYSITHTHTHRVNYIINKLEFIMSENIRFRHIFSTRDPACIYLYRNLYFGAHTEHKLHINTFFFLFIWGSTIRVEIKTRCRGNVSLPRFVRRIIIM